MAQPVLSMSTKGILYNPHAKADKLMSYYFTSNKSQSNLFQEIISLPYQIQVNSGKEKDTVTNVEIELRQYLANYFDQVDCTVRSDIPNPEDPGRYNLTVSVLIMQDGISYSLARLLEVQHGTIYKIINYNNKGNWT